MNRWHRHLALGCSSQTVVARSMLSMNNVVAYLDELSPSEQDILVTFARQQRKLRDVEYAKKDVKQRKRRLEKFESDVKEGERLEEFRRAHPVESEMVMSEADIQKMIAAVKTYTERQGLIRAQIKSRLVALNMKRNDFDSVKRLTSETKEEYEDRLLTILRDTLKHEIPILPEAKKARLVPRFGL